MHIFNCEVHVRKILHFDQGESDAWSPPTARETDQVSPMKFYDIVGTVWMLLFCGDYNLILYG